MHQGRCAAVLRGSRSSRVALLLGMFSWAACSAILDPDRDALGGRPRSDFEGPDAGGDGDGSASGDGDGDGDPTQCAGTCDDGVACTVDGCDGDLCTHVVDDGACALDERCHQTKGCIPVRCRDATDCNDGDPCNGTETCNPAGAGSDPRTGCSTGSAPDCDDRVDCTNDSCMAGVGCVHTADDAACSDGVDCTIDTCDATTGCTSVTSDQRCNACFAGGSSCNAVLGCLGGFERSCSDDDPCTVDECSVELAMCTHELSPSSDPSCAVQPDDCAQAETLELDGDGSAEVVGRFSRVASNYDTSCGESGAHDAVYALEVNEVSDIVLDTVGSEAQTVLAVAHGNCSEQGFEFACAGSVGPNEPESRLVLHRYDPQALGKRLYVLVDGLRAAALGQFSLHVSVQPVARDGCFGEPLALDGCGTVVGFMDARDPANRWGVLRGPCQNGGDGQRAPEAVLSVPGASDGKVSLAASSDAFTPALYARTVCDSEDNNDQLGCELASQQSGQADFTVDLGADERGYVIIDGGRDGAQYLFRCIP